MTDSNIERVVMRRVHAVHALRPLFSNAMLALVVFLLALYGIGREVWVSRVFQNAPHANVLAALRFFALAFLDTRLIVQVLCAVALIGFIWFVRNVIRGMSGVSVLAQA